MPTRFLEDKSAHKLTSSASLPMQPDDVPTLPSFPENQVLPTATANLTRGMLSNCPNILNIQLALFPSRRATVFPSDV